MTTSTAPRRPSAAVRWLIAIVVIGALGLTARRMTSAVAVETVVVEQRDIVETLAVVGRVRAPARAALGASISGTVTQVLVDEGDLVQAGQLLVTLENRESSASVRQSEAALADATARAQQAVADAEREVEQADRDLERLRAVLETGGVARQTLEQAEQRAGNARSRLEAARALTPGGESTEPAPVAVARAALESARARLALTRITAPSSGVVLTRSVEPGDAVSPGRGILEIAFDGPAELIVFPGEENLSRLTPGAVARASADAFADRDFPATVSLIAPTVDASQGTVAVRLSLPNPPDYLLPDMTVSVNIETGQKPGAAVLPDDAIQGMGVGAPWVGVVSDGRLERRDITTGLRAEGFIEVLTGVSAGDAVVRSASAEDVGRRVRVTRGEG